MKRVCLVVLALVLVLSLCGCDSADYKKAMEAYDAGDFLEAREMFEELGDYEDSAEMVSKCSYKQGLKELEDGNYAEARELFVALDDYEDSAEKVMECDYEQALQELEDGNYAEARSIFLSLGDYEDCRAKAVAAARWMLVEYVEQKGTMSKISDDNSSATAVSAEDDQIVVAYVVKFTGMIEMDFKVGAAIAPESDTMLVVGVDTLSTYAAHYDATASMTLDPSTYKSGDTLESTASMTLDPSTYKSGDTLEWEDFEVSGVTAQGTAYTREVTMLDMVATNSVKNALAYLQEVLADSGLGLTMADIGFTNY